MQAVHKAEEFEPLFEADTYTVKERKMLSPFFTNLNKSVFVPLGMSPEVIGALCSRASRAAGDLRQVFLDEYIKPFLSPEREAKDSDQEWAAKLSHSEALNEFISFLQRHSWEDIFSNPRARAFYIKWLAQYGDDSIAQMAGLHLVYSSLSVLAIKHFEDQRIGLAPIEKSTRYVDYGSKVRGHYQYYTDPKLDQLGLTALYEKAMDGLFDTYVELRPKVEAWLAKKYPDEKPKVIETKAYDTLRGLLPISTLSQLAMFGNGQAFEYMVARSLKHPLGEVRWAAQQAFEELYQVTPSFLRRLSPDSQEDQAVAEQYQEYMAGRGKRTAPFVDKHLPDAGKAEATGLQVDLIEYDPLGEAKVVAGILYSAPNNHHSWSVTLEMVAKMSDHERTKVLDAYLHGREQRWQKVGRALENVYVRFDIVLNWGAWKDLQRHRMLTQQRQYFTVKHGYDVPAELVEAGLDGQYRQANDALNDVYDAIAEHDLALAQYVVTHGHRVRFMQWTNLRSCFWEMELRTIPEGHPDYRLVEQKKFKLLEQVYPLIVSRMRVNMGSYDFARRGQEEKIQAKLESLEKMQV